MADNENTKTSAGLGELFIEFGSKGLGGLVKGLNTVSASFLLTKNAGQQMLQPLANMSKQAGQGIVQLQKLGAATGFVEEKNERLKKWAEKNHIDFGNFYSQIQNAQQQLAQAKYDMNGAVAKAFQRAAGIDVRNYDTSNPEALLNDLRKSMQGLRNEQKLYLLSMVGMNEEMIYAWEKGNRKVDERNILTQKERQSLLETYDALTELDQSWHTHLDRTIAKIGTKFIPLLENVSELIKNIFNRDGEDQLTKDQVLKRRMNWLLTASSSMAAGAAIGSVIPGVGTIAGGVIGGLIGSVAGFVSSENLEAQMVAENKKNKPKTSALAKQNTQYQTYNTPQPQVMQTTQVTPSALQNYNYGRPSNMYNNTSRNQEINIEVHQEIYGQDGTEIANDFTTNISENIQRQMDNVQRNNGVSL